MQPTRVHWWVEATGCPDVSVSIRRHDDDGGRAEGGGGGGGGSSSTAQAVTSLCVCFCQRGFLKTNNTKILLSKVEVFFLRGPHV